MEYDLILANESDKSVLFNLMQLYTYELSKYSDETAEIELNEHGLYNIKYFDYFWIEKDRFPFILKYENELVGFALVRFNEDNMYEISEFFVLPKFRRTKVGTFMANEVFKKFKGNWEIRTLLKNETAQQFWRNTIRSFSNDEFEEKYIRNNLRLAFYFESK